MGVTILQTKVCTITKVSICYWRKKNESFRVFYNKTRHSDKLKILYIYLWGSFELPKNTGLIRIKLTPNLILMSILMFATTKR